jgi:hypothetical protein
MNTGPDSLPRSSRDGRHAPYRTEDLKRAERKWRGLTRSQRKEVLRLSKRGQIHPDKPVADVAYQWASIKVHVGERNVMAKPAVAVPLALIMLLVPGGGGWAGGTIQYWKTLRAARRIVQATERSRHADVGPE